MKVGLISPRSFKEWLFHVPIIGPFLSGFVLPRSSKSAFNFICWSVICLITQESIMRQGYSDWFFLPFIYALLGFLSIFWAGGVIGGAIVYYVTRRFKSDANVGSVEYPLSVRSAVRFILEILFVAWLCLFVTGHSYRLFNKVAFLTWAAYVVVGCAVGFVRGCLNVGNARRQRKQLAS